MRAKRICIVVFVVAVAALLVPRGTTWGRTCAALAEFQSGDASYESHPKDTLSVSVAVSPSSMAVPSEAKVYLTLVNGSNVPIDDVVVRTSDGVPIREVGRLSTEERPSFVFDEAKTPTQKQLQNGGLRYELTYTLKKGTPHEEHLSMTVLAPIAKLGVEPKLDFTRSLSACYAQPGEEICVTYRLRNTGNVALTDMTLEDPLCGEIGHVEHLGPGKKMSFTKSITIHETTESKPSVTYHYPGHEEFMNEHLDALPIYQADELLEAHLDADKGACSPGEVVTLQLKLVNKGDVTYDRLEISDQVLGKLGSVPVELKPGDEYVFVKRVNLKTTTTFLFSISGKSSGGSPVSSSSNMLTVAVTPVVDSIKLSVEATADNTQLTGPGLVNFSIKIRNAGELDIRNVVISERALGPIKNLAVAAPGETTVQYQYHVDQDTSFMFMAELTDAEGGQLTVLSNPAIDVKIQSTKAMVALGSEPSAPASPDNTGILGLGDTAYRMDDNTKMFNRMVAGVMGVLAVLLVVLTASAAVQYMHKRKMRKLQLKRLKRGRRGAQIATMKGNTGYPTARGKLQQGVDGDTGVYSRSDFMRGNSPQQNLSTN